MISQRKNYNAREWYYGHHDVCLLFTNSQRVHILNLALLRRNIYIVIELYIDLVDNDRTLQKSICNIMVFYHILSGMRYSTFAIVSFFSLRNSIYRCVNEKISSDSDASGRIMLLACCLSDTGSMICLSGCPWQHLDCVWISSMPFCGTGAIRLCWCHICVCKICCIVLGNAQLLHDTRYNI